MICTIVHDDADIVKLQIKQIRENLNYVKPSISFKSCCVSDFHDKTFDGNQLVLVILSQRSGGFRKLLYENLLKYEASDHKTKCRIFLVVEAKEGSCEEDYVSVVGIDHVAIVDDLQASFKWLPKMCRFLFRKKKQKRLPACVIPKAEDGSVPALLREHLLTSLEEIGLKIAENFGSTLPRCCILFRKEGDDNEVTSLKEKADAVKKNGGQVIEYRLSLSDRSERRKSNEFAYVKDGQILFIIHILFITELVDIKTLRGEKLWKRRKPRRRPSCNLRKFRNHFGTIACCLLLFLLVVTLTPNFALLFLTPFPYIGLAYKLGDEEWLYTLGVWLIFSLYGLSATLTYFMWETDARIRLLVLTCSPLPFYLGVVQMYLATGFLLAAKQLYKDLVG